MPKVAQVAKKERLNEEDYRVLKEKLKARKQILKNLPIFTLTNFGLSASLSLPPEVRTPIEPSDVQTLLMYGIAGHQASIYPFQWCKPSKWSNLAQVVVVVIDGISVKDFEENSAVFSEVSSIFENAVEVLNPLSDGLTFSQELAYVPASVSLKTRIMNEYPSFAAARQAGVLFDAPSLFPSKESATSFGSSDRKKIEMKLRNESFSRLSLMLNHEQMIAEHFPVPGLHFCRSFKFTKSKYEPVTDRSPMFGVDCEWVQCIRGQSGLARVAMVDEHGRTVYHTLVKPHLPVVDYLTQFSGITPQLLRGCTTTLRDVQVAMQSILPPDAILVGQSLGGDLIAMELMHPYIIDSSVIYNLSGHRRRKSKLSLLSQTFLGEAIQQSTSGHDPTEDSLAAVKLVNHKLTKSYEYGDVILAPMDEEPKRLLRTAVQREAELTSKKNGEGNQGFGQSTEVSQTSGTSAASTPEEDMVDKYSSLFVKFYTYVRVHSRSAFCVASADVLKDYKPPAKWVSKAKAKLPDDFSTSAVQNAQMLEANDMNKAMNVLQWRMTDHYFSMMHTTCENRDEATWKHIDKKVGSIYKSLKDNGVMICVFGGSSVPKYCDSRQVWENGVAFINVKVDKSNIPTL